MGTEPTALITGGTAADIADSVRGLVERGRLSPGQALPPVRALAEQLGVNRNTAVAAYRTLARSGVVVSQGRAGTRVARRPDVPQEGFTAAGPLRDVGNGNPDPRLIPDLAPALATVAGRRPVLYGEPVIDPDLKRWAQDWMTPDVPGDADQMHLTLTSGAVDAVERLLAQALLRDDTVALEDPCFLASIQLAQHGGYRAVPVPVDSEGMTVAGLRAALDHGARAVVSTPRAQNPTGASLTAARAAALREVLADHPYVLVVQDDYFSYLSRQPFHSIIGPEHQRWALVRSVSKFAGPDMCLAVTATDAVTAARLEMRLSPGTTWVSHLLQRVTHSVMTDEDALTLIDEAATHYADRNTAFAELLSDRGLATTAGDGMSLWITLPAPARDVAERLTRRGWLVRTGDEFRLEPSDEPSPHLRLTVHDLSHEDATTLATDIADVVGEIASTIGP